MKTFFNNTKYLIRKAGASRISAYSAQAAFFMFLSLIPMIMLLLSLLNRIGSSETEITVIAYEFMPSAVSSFFDTYIEEIMDSGKLSLTIISALVLLWSASKGVFAIIGGLNSVYEIKEDRNYFLLRFFAILYTVAFVLILMFALMVMVFGSKFNDFICSMFPNITGLVYIISSLRYILGFAMLVLFFTLLYKMLPNGKIKFTKQVPGAVLASGGWVAFSFAFSFFVENFSNYANIYGSLSAIIVFMLWLYTCMYILFIGAEINLILGNRTN